MLALLVVLVCYPGPKADDCGELQAKLTGCGYSVRRLDDPDPRNLLELRKETFPERVPVLVAGHGAQGFDNDGKRYSFVTRPNARLARTRHIREALTAALPAPSIWFGACRTGTSCSEEGPCFGDHCLGFTYPPFASRSESTLGEITGLLCDRKAPVWGSDGVIDAAELNQHLCHKYGGPRSTLELKVTAIEAVKVRKRFSGQAGLIGVEEEAYSLGRGSARRRLVKFTATFLDGCSVGVDPKSFTLHAPAATREPAASHHPVDF